MHFNLEDAIYFTYHAFPIGWRAIPAYFSRMGDGYTSLKGNMSRWEITGADIEPFSLCSSRPIPFSLSPKLDFPQNARAVLGFSAANFTSG